MRKFVLAKISASKAYESMNYPNQHRYINLKNFIAIFTILKEKLFFTYLCFIISLFIIVFHEDMHWLACQKLLINHFYCGDVCIQWVFCEVVPLCVCNIDHCKICVWRSNRLLLLEPSSKAYTQRTGNHNCFYIFWKTAGELGVPSIWTLEW